MAPLPRLYPILDTEKLARRNFPVLMAAEAMLEAGARILQLRHKSLWSRGVFEQADYVGRLCRHFGAQWMINDRADVAALLDAGVHLGQDDLAPADARKVVGEARPIGLSTHNEAQLRAAAMEPAEYVALGPVFGTRSKRNPDPEVGVENLRAWRALTAGPLVAIGGIRRDRAREVIAAGADAVAVISDLLPEDMSKKKLRERVEEWLKLLS
ncbi:MAG: thiamine phosphate synthase [Bryobacteraceae bacterium]